jgi:hypothetical protein
MLGTAPFFLLPHTAIAAGARAAVAGGKALTAAQRAGQVYSNLPLMGQALTKAAKLKEAGSIFNAGALREAAIFAPIETARLAGGAINQFAFDEEGALKRTRNSAAADILGIGILGGGIAKLGSFRGARSKQTGPFKSKAQESVEGRLSQAFGEKFDRNAPTQVNFDKLTSMDRAGLPPSVVADIETLIGPNGFYNTNIRRQVPEAGKAGAFRYVRPVQKTANRARWESLFHSAQTGVGSRTSGQVHPLKITISDKGQTGGYTGSAKEIVTLANGEEVNAFQRAESGWLQLTEDVKDWQGFTQYPRKLELGGKIGPGGVSAGEEQLLKVINKHRIADDGWMIKENSEGLNIIVKRIDPKTEGGTFANFLTKSAQRVGDTRDSQYYIFKTNKPGAFFPNVAETYESTANAFYRGTKWRRSADVTAGSVPTLVRNETTADMIGGQEAALHSGFAAGTEPGRASATKLGLMIDRWVPRNVALRRAELIRGAKQPINKLTGPFVPSRLLGFMNPKMAGMLGTMKREADFVNTRTIEMIEGPFKPEFMDGAVTPLVALLKTAIKPENRRVGGIRKLIEDGLQDPAALNDFNQIKMLQMPIADAVKLNKNPEAIRVLRALEKLDDDFIAEATAQAAALGTEFSLVPMKNHYAIAATWIGDFRLPIFDIGGKVRGIASGHSSKQAGEEAITLIDKINKRHVKGGQQAPLKEYSFDDGSKLLVDDHMDKLAANGFKNFGDPEDLKDAMLLTSTPTDVSATQADVHAFAKQIRMNNIADEYLAERARLFQQEPQRFTKSTGKLGARGTAGSPFKTVKEITTQVGATIVENNRYLSREAQAHTMSEQFTKLMREDPTGHDRLVKVWNAVNGVAGPFSRQITKHTDNALADWLGPNWAMKSVRGVNEAMFNLTLAAGDVGFAALNILTPIQTAIPEVANLLNSPIAVLQKYYSNSLVKVPEGGFRQVHFMDPLKFAKIALREVVSPDAKTIKAIKGAMDEAIIGRQFTETVHGGMRSIVEGEGGFIRRVLKWSEAPVVFTEEASRMYSFVLGRRVGLDFFKMAESEAFEFGRQFTHRTMFGYTAADRPRVLTGALGAGWGLFKNWSMNYAGNMVGYTAQAARGNWNPLVWSFATTAGVGGATAVPLAGMADGMAHIFADKGINDFIYDAVGNGREDSPEDRPWAADFLAHGFPSLLGFTLRSRASAPASHLMTDLALFSNVAIFDRAEAMVDSVGSFIGNVGQSRNPWEDPGFRREMLRAFAPRTMQRWASSFGERGYMSLNTGNNLMPALSASEASLSTVGLTPLGVANSFEVQHLAWENANAQREEMQRYGELVANAQLNGDHGQFNRLLGEAAGRGLLVDSVLRSATSRVRKQLEPTLELQFQDAVTRGRMKARGVQ